MNIYKQKMSGLRVLFLSGLLVIGGCENPDEDANVFGDPNTGEGVLTQIVIGQLARPVFYRSYNYQTALGYCRNAYKIPLLDFSATDSACQSAANCTVQTTVCLSTSAVGVCRFNSSLESRVEDVYYSPIYSVSSAAAACASLNGAFDTSYVP